MGSLRELQELLRVKDERIAELEAILCRRDAEIQELRSHLDKFLSVLPFKSPLTPTKPRPRKQRAQGISAEPPLQEFASLTVVDKNDRIVGWLGVGFIVGLSGVFFGRYDYWNEKYLEIIWIYNRRLFTISAAIMDLGICVILHVQLLRSIMQSHMFL
ncbi:cGMP-dependent protein kinase 1 [Dufourea novaeangliae]|uniref:cGMP-dependent protein kinase 1 n=1 Tax=Dufourea novaeangliae TaxID=178035 RepID=A0A154PU87_DUFNO|nr:cGMP-dependent protein kinase 1 [Dufourea novaeangliae]